MRKIRVSLLVMLALLIFSTMASASPGESVNFVAPLSGAQEVPARDTLARGNAVFHLSDDGSALSYKLIAANINNITASHIHCGSIGVSGPVGVNLYVGAPIPGRFDGILASGTITGPNAVNGCGWATLDDVVAALRSGNAYVNVHTNDFVDPANTGPGDFPGGEIRGQVYEAGPTR